MKEEVLESLQDYYNHPVYPDLVTRLSFEHNAQTLQEIHQITIQFFDGNQPFLKGTTIFNDKDEMHFIVSVLDQELDRILMNFVDSVFPREYYNTLRVYYAGELIMVQQD